MPFEHLLNADFDLSLRPRWRPPETGSVRRWINDLQWHALHLAGPDDSIVVPEPPPGDFVEYLDNHGIAMPGLTVDPAIRSRATLSPFGWNAAAERRNRLYDTPAHHPSPVTVSRVNGRRFSADLETQRFGGDHVVGVFSGETELRAALAAQPNQTDGWVVKSEHGNAGVGNRRVRHRDLSAGDLTAIRRFFDEDDAVVLERWRPRLADLCATFTVVADGLAVDVGLHETVNTAEGALIGNLFHADPGPLARWRPAMERAVDTVARALGGAGYAGPACIDAFVWNDRGRPRLRPLVELNARREISAGASALWRRFGGGGTAYWRFYTRRKIELPGSYAELEKALGDDAHDPSRHRGVLVTAPLWLGAERRRPGKAALLLLADDRDDALALDARFRKRFET